VLDYLNYYGQTINRSFGSYPDGQTKTRQIFQFATPGTTNNPAFSPTPAVLNEWMADNAGPDGFPDPADGLFQDWFELYNPNTNVVDLSGYFLTDTLSQPRKFQIPVNTFIQPQGFLLVWADNNPLQNGTGTNGDLHANFQLSSAGEAIGLFAPDGTAQSTVTFGPQIQNVSQGRWPDGNSGGALYFMTNFTPRTSNILNVTNRPPTLAPIGNKSGNELTQISFTATASDPDVGQTLRFSIDAGAPAGVSINPGSGVFTWTPSEAQGPGSYQVTVRVTDNGSPNLTASETITITVNEVNAVPVLAPIGNQTVNENSTLTLTAEATDSDIPANSLAYSLDAGAPAGASIDSGTGVFTWTPTEAQGPGVYSVSVRVTDNG